MPPALAATAYILGYSDALSLLPLAVRTLLTLLSLPLSLHLNLKPKARYRSGARSEGCGLCSVPKRCETRG